VRKHRPPHRCWTLLEWTPWRFKFQHQRKWLWRLPMALTDLWPGPSPIAGSAKARETPVGLAGEAGARVASGDSEKVRVVIPDGVGFSLPASILETRGETCLSSLSVRRRIRGSAVSSVGLDGKAVVLRTTAFRAINPVATGSPSPLAK
jgi:hypothetical protein